MTTGLLLPKYYLCLTERLSQQSPHNTAEPLKAVPHNTAEPLKAVKLLCVFLNAGAFRCAGAVTRVNEALLAAVVIVWNRCTAEKCQ